MPRDLHAAVLATALALAGCGAPPPAGTSAPGPAATSPGSPTAPSPRDHAGPRGAPPGPSPTLRATYEFVIDLAAPDAMTVRARFDGRLPPDPTLAFVDQGPPMQGRGLMQAYRIPQGLRVTDLETGQELPAGPPTTGADRVTRVRLPATAAGVLVEVRLDLAHAFGDAEDAELQDRCQVRGTFAMLRGDVLPVVLGASYGDVRLRLAGTPGLELFLPAAREADGWRLPGSWPDAFALADALGFTALVADPAHVVHRSFTPEGVEVEVVQPRAMGGSEELLRIAEEVARATVRDLGVEPLAYLPTGTGRTTATRRLMLLAVPAPLRAPREVSGRYANGVASFYVGREAHVQLPYLVAHEWTHAWNSAALRTPPPGEFSEWFSEGYTDFRATWMLARRASSPAARRQVLRESLDRALEALEDPGAPAPIPPLASYDPGGDDGRGYRALIEGRGHLLATLVALHLEAASRGGASRWFLELFEAHGETREGSRGLTYASLRATAVALAGPHRETVELLFEQYVEGGSPLSRAQVRAWLDGLDLDAVLAPEVLG